ncbi:cobalt ECF transporter T component CbiQ [Brevibacillus fluminis]|uniref:Cobalt ECF transporter T component CbiQ n=2 Tax=Brevibacillus fluminis TaxID=511487 RepID=A0A3M8DQB9_9BACL|nr:cobalt ECF transporter T component CbiQ [Brevibacillus fluminis]
MSMQIDTLAYGNRLRHLPPGQKVLFACVLLVLVLAGQPLVQWSITAWISLWIVAYANIPFSFYAKMVAVASLFLFASLPALLIEITAASHLPANSLYAIHVSAWAVYLSKAGLEKAVILFSRSIASFACLSFILLTVPFAEMMQVLKRLRVPTLICELLMVMYRFVFVIWEAAAQLYVGQQARGGYNGIRAGLKDAGMLVRMLFVRTMQRYRQLSIGLAARGFQGDLRVLSLTHYKRSARHEAEAVLGIVLLAGMELWMGGYL